MTNDQSSDQQDGAHPEESTDPIALSADTLDQVTGGCDEHADPFGGQPWRPRWW
ncbi:MAG: hypothetical protein LC118_16975 [Dehalococcoidia bacterium]|nr:hypothetical protein [Dehalococcoidia bacterium]